MQAVAEVIIGPEHVLGVLGEVLVAEEDKRAAKVVGADIPVRPVGQIFGE